MIDNVKIMNAGVKIVADGRWKLFAKNISLQYGFDAVRGLVLEQFDHLAGSRPVHYNPASSLLPFEYTGQELWTLESAKISEADYGGRPVARLDVVLSVAGVRAYFHAAAFPGVSIIRQWYELENRSLENNLTYAIKPFRMFFSIDDYRDTYRCLWFKGGQPRYDYGQLCQEAIGSSVDIHLHSLKHYDYVPLFFVLRHQDPSDGIMVAMDYCGTWNLEITRRNGPVSLEFGIDESKPVVLQPGEKIELPVVTLGVFKESLDDLMKTVYDWQYGYLWDYTHSDYYAKSRSLGSWVYNGRNLHEQFGYRLVNMNLQQAVICQEAGYDMLWDDAGWSVYPGWPPDEYGSVFRNIYEGPDYRQSQRFFKKCDLRWCLWFAGKPTLGLLESKEGSWGCFEWRTDGIDLADIRDEREFRTIIQRYLDGDRKRSFHTCSGGSLYAHTFDIQRYSNYNYSADLGAGPYGNYYHSYFELPDKWGDLLCWFGKMYLRKDGASVNAGDRRNSIPGAIRKEDVHYVPEFARARLGMVPLPGPMYFPDDVEASRKDLEIYRYLINQGLAGRWSYMFHPDIFGDDEFYYLQRTSHDFKRGCIIPRHTPKNPVTIYPKNLWPEDLYQVSFSKSTAKYTRTGLDLMKNGIHLEKIPVGELVYLNLPGLPGSGTDRALPEEPGRAVCRVESNIGHSGIGVYWSVGKDENWISFYEIARNDRVIGRASTGTYYFDYANNWDINAVYTVRTVDGDGNRSPWRAAQRVEGESLQFSTLGGHSDVMGRHGWSAEISTDLKTFLPMTWVSPENNPVADLGGTPNQVGGIEGYWQGGVCARIGRGWQQASPDVYCIRTYTVLTDGIVRVIGRAMKEWYHQNKGGDLRVCILHNGCSVWPSEGWAEVKRGDLYGAAHDVRLHVKAGDTIRFVLDQSAGGDDDLFPWLEQVNLTGWHSRVVYEEDVPRTEQVDTIHINCGSETSITDREGHVWSRDRYFMGEDTKSVLHEEAVEEPLLTTGRVGESIIYDVPVPLGLYAVRLCFIESDHRWRDEREMDIEINGKVVARNFDIVAEGRGRGRKVENIYHYIVPDAEGNIHIRLKGKRGKALIGAIEIAPEDHSVVRINCGSTRAFIDWAGFVWEADRSFVGGTGISAKGEVAQATPTIYDQGLYLTGREGNRIEYHIPVGPGIYSVHLKFAEIWLEKKGERPVNIFINGRQVKAGWDSSQAAERLRMAADLRFEGISPVDGQIIITLSAVGQNPAVIQGIEVE